MIDIIPAIDLIDGQCVRLTQGDFARKTVYSSDPVSMALQFQEAGLKRLHLVDLDGARTGKIANLETLEQIVKSTSLVVDFGGGIKTEEDLKQVLDAGAAMVNIGSMSYKEPETIIKWAEQYGVDKFILGADVINERIATNGWQNQTELHIDDYISSYQKHGISRICCTDISKDGMLGGAAVTLYKKLLNRFPGIHLIASGGVGAMEDITALEACGCKGVIVGKAIYEQKITLEQLKNYIYSYGAN